MWMEAGHLIEFRMGLTFLPESRISRELVDFLRPLGFATAAGGSRFHLHGLSVAGLEVPNFEVGVSGQLRRAEVEGLLGLDFLQRFREISLNPSTTFVDP